MDDEQGVADQPNGQPKDLKMGPWTPRQATERIRAYANDPFFDLSYKQHAKEQLTKRDLTTGDALYVLKKGFVYADPLPATQPGYFRYAMEGSTPNSGGRSLRVIVIPTPCRPHAKVVTVMWVDGT